MSILREAIEMSAVGEWIRPFAEQEREISDLLWRLKEDGVQPAFIDMIFKAIETGKSSGDIASEAMENLAERKSKDKLITFTAKEMEVLASVAKGLRNKEIAIKLFNSEETIKKHISNMFLKMNVKNRLSLVSRATEAGILEKVN
jgi:DNA-binding NarL/FixJ family response regulator